MKFSELRDDSAVDLAKEVERLRLEVSLAQAGCLGPPDGPVDDEEFADTRLP